MLSNCLSVNADTASIAIVMFRWWFISRIMPVLSCPVLSVLSYHFRGFNLGSYLALRGNDSDGSYARMVHVGDVDLTPFLVQ
jgi:hypothetical protein